MSGYTGALNAIDMVSDYNATVFLIRQIMAENNHAELVKVISCTSSGGVSPSGFVDVQPLVSLVDGTGKSYPHGTVHRLKYMRVQGGANAVIIDPVAGDVGIAVYADKDTSGVIASGGVSPPGSGRRNDRADGIYLGNALNAAPTQFIQFSASGIAITSPTAITLNAGGKTLTINSAGITIDGILFETHVHSGVTAGSSNTGGPV